MALRPEPPSSTPAPAAAAPSNAAPLAPPQGEIAGPDVAPPPVAAAVVAKAALRPAAIKAADKAAKTAIRSAALAQAVLYGNVLVERGLKGQWTDENWLHVWVCRRCGLGEAACGLNPKPGVAIQCIAAGKRKRHKKQHDDFIPW